MNVELRVYVERAVRPIHASFERKMRMREELGDVISQIHAEESRRHREPDRALQATYERFGDPTSLSRELQGTVGHFERIANCIVGLLEPGNHESRLHHAARLASISGVILGVATLFGQCLLVLRGGGLNWIQGQVLLGTAGVFFVDTLVVTWLGTRCHAGFTPHAWKSAWVKPQLWFAGLIAALTIMMTKLCLIHFAGGDWEAIGRVATHWTWGAPAIMLVFILVFQMYECERSRGAEWECLKLD